MNFFTLDDLCNHGTNLSDFVDFVSQYLDGCSKHMYSSDPAVVAACLGRAVQCCVRDSYTSHLGLPRKRFFSKPALPLTHSLEKLASKWDKKINTQDVLAGCYIVAAAYLRVLIELKKGDIVQAEQRMKSLANYKYYQTSHQAQCGHFLDFSSRTNSYSANAADEHWERCANFLFQRGHKERLKIFGGSSKRIYVLPDCPSVLFASTCAGLELNQEFNLLRFLYSAMGRTGLTPRPIAMGDFAPSYYFAMSRVYGQSVAELLKKEKELSNGLVRRVLNASFEYDVRATAELEQSSYFGVHLRAVDHKEEFYKKFRRVVEFARSVRPDDTTPISLFGDCWKRLQINIDASLGWDGETLSDVVFVKTVQRQGGHPNLPSLPAERVSAAKKVEQIITKITEYSASFLSLLDQEQRIFTHGDINSGNAFLTADSAYGVCFLDPMKAALRFPLIDSARFVEHESFEGAINRKTAREHCIDWYSKYARISKDKAALLWFLSSFFITGCLSGSVVRYDYDKGDVERNKRLHFYFNASISALESLLDVCHQQQHQDVRETINRFNELSDLVSNLQYQKT